MCMNTVEKRATIPKSKPILAWKVFVKTGTDYRAPYYNGRYRRNRWYKSRKGPGFHTFEMETGAASITSYFHGCVVRRVKLRGRAKYGIQRGIQRRGYRGWTAAEMLVL